jgi:hypothetical protein
MSGKIIPVHSKDLAFDMDIDASKEKTPFGFQSITSPGPIFSVSVYKNSVIWCAGRKNGKLAQAIYKKDPGQKDGKLIYKVDFLGKKQVMPVKLHKNRIAWVEYIQREEDMVIIWELCTMELGNQNSKRTVVSNKHNHQIQFPRFDMEGDLLVYDLVLLDRKNQYDSPLYVYKISEDMAKPLLHLAGYDLFAPDIHGNEIVFCKLSPGTNNHVVSELGIYDWMNQELSHLEITGRGYEPCLTENYLIFKESSSLYAYGHIKLYDRKKNTLTTLSSIEPGGELPYVGVRYAVWESPFFDKIEGYDLEEKRGVVFEKGNTGKPFLLGNSLVWVAEPEPKTVFIRYLDLPGR